jgi:hypothetical protein
LGVLGTQETFCIVIAGLLERDSFDLFLPEFDKPWVIPLKGNLLLFYKPLHLEAQQVSTRIEVRRHQGDVLAFHLPRTLSFHSYRSTSVLLFPLLLLVFVFALICIQTLSYLFIKVYF